MTGGLALYTRDNEYSSPEEWSACDVWLLRYSNIKCDNNDPGDITAASLCVPPLAWSITHVRWRIVCFLCLLNFFWYWKLTIMVAWGISSIKAGGGCECHCELDVCNIWNNGTQLHHWSKQRENHKAYRTDWRPPVMTRCPSPPRVLVLSWCHINIDTADNSWFERNCLLMPLLLRSEVYPCCPNVAPRCFQFREYSDCSSAWV